MKRMLFLLLLPVAATAQNGKEFQLKGTLNLDRPAEMVFLRYVSVDKPVMDSVQPKDGAFAFQGQIAEPVLATLTVRYVRQPEQEKAASQSVQLFMEPAEMEFEGQGALDNSGLKGSASHLEFRDFQNMRTPFSKKLEPLYAAYEQAAKNTDKEAMEKTMGEIEAVNAEIEEKVYKTFLLSHKTSPVGLYALKQYAGWNIDPARVEPLFLELSPDIRQLPSAVSLKNQVDIAKKTAIGSYAMDFTQNDTLGKPVSLSSFRGKYVLVDFWASWCGPCRRENPNVVKAFNTYKDRNFTVLGVSLDRPDAKDKWMAAIHKDGLTWTQVSDLKFWDNAVAKQYGIRAIPQNLLIDPSGKIIAKNINGEALQKKLEEVLPK